MRKLILAGAIVLAMAGCTPDQKETARSAAAAAIDASCANLPAMDLEWQLVAPRANGSAQLAYQAAKAVLEGVCDNRPLDKPELQVAAATAAIGKIAMLVATYKQGH